MKRNVSLQTCLASTKYVDLGRNRSVLSLCLDRHVFSDKFMLQLIMPSTIKSLSPEEKTALHTEND